MVNVDRSSVWFGSGLIFPSVGPGEEPGTPPATPIETGCDDGFAKRAWSYLLGLWQGMELLTDSTS
jgi:hypothetical protein